MQGFRSRGMHRLRFVSYVLRLAVAQVLHSCGMLVVCTDQQLPPTRGIAPLICRNDEIICDEIIFFDMCKYLEILISDQLYHLLSINKITVHPIRQVTNIINKLLLIIFIITNKYY